ncbi:MAG: NADH-quinone oxidoreductase subunit D [Dehalococcoidia bacterium]|nr:NADH-quinone oxidoreductase subunit D [Dehalococcoidia bacterium]
MTTERALRTVDMHINVGPQHPATHGVFRMVLEVDGERVAGCTPYIGYLHRGFEKLAENEEWQEVIIHLDRTDYISQFNNELCYAMGMERLLGVEPPERAEYARVILAELNRIVSHMMFYGAFGADVGALTPFLYAFRERERLQRLFEAVSGARLMHFYFRAGGLKEDLPEGFADELRRMLPAVQHGIDECDRLLTQNEVFLSRTVGVGKLAASEAIAYGCSGPVLRASGVREDVRRSDPYSLYPTLDFDVPVGKNGDCFDRYWVRLAEMRESVRIVQQCLDRLPEGPIRTPVPRYPHFRVEPGEIYVHTENPRGDYGLYLVSKGGVQPYRVKLRSPCFCNLMALGPMLRDSYLADAVVILGSLDIVLGEVDR